MFRVFATFTDGSIARSNPQTTREKADAIRVNWFNDLEAVVKLEIREVAE